MSSYSQNSCPINLCQHIWLSRQVNWEKAVKIDSKYKNQQVLFKFKAPTVNFEHLKKDCLNAFDKYGWFGFSNSYNTNEQRERSKYYGGLGLTYNPNYQADIEPHAQVFGAPPNKALPSIFLKTKVGLEVFEKLMTAKKDKFFLYNIAHLPSDKLTQWLIENGLCTPEDGTSLINELKKFDDQKRSPVLNNHLNTYRDCYGFHKLTPAAHEPNILNFLLQFRCTLIRSRIAELKSEYGDISANLKMKHRDENIFHELRLILPVLVDDYEQFGLHIENNGDHCFEPNTIYHFDNSIPHSATCYQFNGKRRINIIVAVSPWFDFDLNTKLWKPNQFLGNKHPLDMLIDGDILPEIELIS